MKVKVIILRIIGLGNFIIENLPKKRAGEAKIKVQFNIDHNSSLEVKAVALTRGLKDRHWKKIKKKTGMYST